jgi:vitamin B12 transporter
MKSFLLPTGSVGRLLVMLAAGALPAALSAQSAPASPAQTETVRLNVGDMVALAPLVVTATRTANDPIKVGSAVDTITELDRARRQQDSLASTLGGTPGAPLFPSGATGATTSLFLRGANSNQTLLLVDGIRFSDANADYNVFLGSATLGAGDTVEIVRGPQSTLYGGEAIGGVVAITTGSSLGQRHTSLSTEAGSFGTVRGALATSGATGGWDYRLNLSGGHTDNVRPNNGLGTAAANTRLDRRISDTLAFGATARWFHSEYGDPGDRFTNDPDDSQREDNTLVTVFAEAQPSPGWSVHATAGGQDRRLVANASFGPFAPNSNAVTTNRRGVIDAQVSFSGVARHRLTAGTTAESTHTRNTGFGAINRRQDSLAYFFQDEFDATDTLHLTAGLRSDDFDTFGRATTGRATAAWETFPKRAKLRASYGTGFRTPSFLDLYGRSAFYAGNPALRPEHARGWDAGLDLLSPFRNNNRLSLTWFENRLSDLISGDFSVFPSTVANVARARTRGAEVSGHVALTGRVHTSFTYTYLEAQNLANGTCLLRRPRHSGSFDLVYSALPTVSLGAGVACAAARRDIDAQTFLTIDGEDYTVARLYGAYEIRRGLTLKVRIENLLNEAYEPVNGYPAPGFGAFGGIEWRW